MVDWNTLGIMGTVAASSLGLGWFMSDKLSSMERHFTKQLTDHKEEDDEKFHDHSLRLYKLELSSFGWTHTGKNPDKMDFLGVDKPSP